MRSFAFFCKSNTVSSKEEETEEKPSSSFPNTRWSLVKAAGDSDDIDRKALGELCEAYWQPIYCYLRRNRSEADAKDLTQGFFEGLLSRDSFSKVDAERGKFRSFILTSLQNFLKNQWRYESAQRRGSGEQPISIDHILAEELYSQEPATTTTPESLYEVRWAKTLYERSIERLRSNYRRRRKEDVFEALLPFLVPHSRTHSYEEVAENLGCSQGAARNAVFQLRQKLKESFKAEVFETVSAPDEVDEEISYLISVIGEDWPFEEDIKN